MSHRIIIRQIDTIFSLTYIITFHLTSFLIPQCMYTVSSFWSFWTHPSVFDLDHLIFHLYFILAILALWSYFFWLVMLESASYELPPLSSFVTSAFVGPIILKLSIFNYSLKFKTSCTCAHRFHSWQHSALFTTSKDLHCTRLLNPHDKWFSPGRIGHGLPGLPGSIRRLHCHGWPSAGEKSLKLINTPSQSPNDGQASPCLISHSTHIPILIACSILCLSLPHHCPIHAPNPQISDLSFRSWQVWVHAFP